MADQTETTEAIVELLGGWEVLIKKRGVKMRNARGLQEVMRLGLPHKSFVFLVEKTELKRSKVAPMLGLVPRTIIRRKGKTLTPMESDRVYRLARTMALAMRVLGSREKAARWLVKKNRSLGGETPAGFLDTEIGARKVEAVLTRIDHGVFS